MSERRECAACALRSEPRPPCPAAVGPPMPADVHEVAALAQTVSSDAARFERVARALQARGGWS